MSTYYGDIKLGDTIDFKFTSRRFTTGAPFTLAGSPTLAAYVGNSTTEITAGITLTADFDSRTGLNHVNVVASTANGYATGTNVDIVITAGTVDSVSVVGEVVGSFSIGNRRQNGIHSGTAQAGGNDTITLASTASATDGLYDPSSVLILEGTGAGQVRLITEYNGTSKVAKVNREWRVNPDSTSVYQIIAAINTTSVNEGIATGGGTNTITLNSLASTVNDTYKGQLIWLITGTGKDQVRLCTAYNGTTKVATVAEAWATNPTSGTGYMVLPAGRAFVAAMINDVITAAAIADNAIDAGSIAADAITSTKIADNAITANKIATGAITNAKFAAGAIDAAAIADNAIDAGAIAADAITSSKIADNAITANKIANDAITAAKIATDAIDSDAIAASAVTEIQNGLATAVAVAQVQSDTDDIQTRLPAALVGGRMDSSVGAMEADVLTATALATSAVNEIQSGLATATAVSDLQATADAIDAKTTNLPSDPADQSLIINATNALALAIENLQQATIERGSVEAIPFDMVDANDVLQPGMTVTVKVSIDGAPWAAGAGSVGVVGEGNYYYTPDTSDTDAAEWGAIKFSATGCKDHIFYFKTSD